MKFILKLALKSIRYRKAALLLSILSISLSVILLLGVERIRSGIHDSFTSTISGTDLVVGARTGNISLLLTTVFHIGYTNQNVSWESYEAISSSPEVSWGIPLSLGDSHKGFPVLGTTADFFAHYKYGHNLAVQPKTGSTNIEEMNCVLGSKVAKELGYEVGDNVVVTHGMGKEEFMKHDDEQFVVTGILGSTGTPVDQTVFVSLFAMDAIHSHFYGQEEEEHDVFEDVLNSHEGHHHQEEEPNSITGFFMGLKNPADILAVQRKINNYKIEPLTAIMPVVTLTELWNIVRPVEKMLMVISVLVLIVALGGILATLITSLNDRRREMAILRSAGAKPKHIFGLILIETIAVILSGILSGIIILQAVAILSKNLVAEKLGLMIPMEWFTINELLLLLSILLLGTLVGILPAYQSYKKSMSDGLTVKK
ncbi:FtsX-like permease family protein [Prolixibacteraceae bacterium Z1-6]|uniref:FtsX-like permease family protein n=1 Tax=Draconibacterium aestuarii TaxID=2998507 RepID=A0A9X3J5Z1_9BACT|nr:FtsX-like permease family protein [Prolixibacteraceae bacterium Z1-6]